MKSRFFIVWIFVFFPLLTSCSSFYTREEIPTDLTIDESRCTIDVKNFRKNKNIIRHPEKELNFFLTFDSGGNDENLSYILKILRKYKIKATFFVTGNFIKKYPARVKEIANEGHVIGNHTFTHNMNFRNEDELLNELYETELLYTKVTGREITRIWRSPGLQHIDKPWMLEAALKLEYVHIDVNLGSYDWVCEDQSEYLSNEEFMELFKKRLNMKNNLHAIVNKFNYEIFCADTPFYHGTIMLMHVGTIRPKKKDFVYTLEDVIKYLIANGYKFDNCRRFEELAWKSLKSSSRASASQSPR